ncbi:MAG: sigma-54 dependent transcriptional regulator [Flavobacteriales bacterium]|jgi:DNA-binding NtrC family response regulator|nr:sigma-54 dependent transcriptional regulator [Flavobacteriales bacterium]MCW8912077.1 sigma-54 dependent transcriptional regulator [Flavobacteriales bacterium]MCW8936717.1 sigma-54 dependent transcriptional regulator [Flavobacteriales bacterium]MCW8941478.1 sigma-54 dependent transcriptional regulator [Flavobacteriales bacterium]MCW8967122.1 sigma-54 dependent transcriptional regulator [Flavobacteriales bacterium]
MESKPFKIYVVEDNEWYNKLLVHNLSLNPDFVVESFLNGKELVAALAKKPDVVTLDYRLPDINGESLLKKIKDYDPNIEVIIISEQEEIETAVDLLKAGAYDYIVKSKNIKDRLINTVNHIKKNAKLKNQLVTLQKEVQGKYAFEKSIIGNSASLKKVFELIAKATETNISVTITGETGTGKEVVSKAIHYNSPRKDKPFVAVNMAALPAELIESELFGHERGAFTGADTRRKGKFEEAGSGTLFLDEIGEMDMNFQAKLLRVLQEKEVTRVGGNEVIKVNCRIIVATNRNLQEEVKNGKFREDLYYRLFGLPIHLPPLRERDNDTLLLAKFFIDAFCKENNLEPKSISENARKKLLSYNWPGNIRELKSVVELAVVMSSGKEINADDISLSSNDALPNVLTDEMTMREYEIRIVNHYMKKCDNNTKLVAERLGIGQTTVYRLLKEDKNQK